MDGPELSLVSFLLTRGCKDKFQKQICTVNIHERAFSTTDRSSFIRRHNEEKACASGAPSGTNFGDDITERFFTQR
jgi:hypothetical protein